jgi:triosephosphate isomerase
VYTEAKGAFTGAVAVGMLKSSGVQYCLAGHRLVLMVLLDM